MSSGAVQTFQADGDLPDRILLPMRFDPVRLKRDIARLEGTEWVEHFVKQNYEGTWSVLPLRAPAGETHPIRMIYSDPSCRAFTDTAPLTKSPYFQEVLGAFRMPIDAVRLMKLSPGSSIREHRDHDLGLEHGRVRLHIPIVTSNAVDFRLNGERVKMNEGEPGYLRLSDPHSVANRGDVERVPLVIDAASTPWLRELLRGPTTGQPKPNR